MFVLSSFVKVCLSKI